MLSNIKMIGWITLASSAFVSLAVAQTDASAPVSSQIANKPTDAASPFIAEVTGNDVYIRSGRGQGYYHCGKINAGKTLTVVDEVSGWAKIVPLPENYSWIHKNYVKINPQTPGVGTVTQDNVRVWAGSDFIEPIRSFSIQTRLNTGELVDLFDPSQADTGDYYKIKTPPAAYLWINADYLRYVGPVKIAEAEKPAKGTEPEKAEEPLTLEEKLGVEPAPALEATPAKEQAKSVEPEKKAEETKPKTPVSKEAALLQQCYDLSDQITAELKKPVKEQDYTAYKQQMKQILEDPEADKAKTYAELLLERIERFELAIGVTDILKEQDKRLEEIRAQIEKARQAQLEKIPTVTERPLYTGIVKPSFVYTGTASRKRYLLTDSAGRILCYLMPVGPEIESRLEQHIGSQITVRGGIVSDPKALVTLVSVTAIETQQ